MKNINFKVSQDTIEKLSEDVVISDSFNYICLIFNFDSSWSQYNVKKATFFSDYEDGEEKYEADIINNVCVVPFEILKKSKFKDSFFIGVYGQVIEDEILKQRNTTNMITFKLRQGAYFANALNPGEIEPSAYDLYLTKLNEVFEKGLNEYNKNADEKIKEINNKVSDIEKIEDNIEQIQKNVQASEQNAKTSETNAKTSEISAQKSAENASEVLTNVTTIQEDINKSKGEINTAKESVDKSLKKVYSAVTEATNQAKESEKQAGIATSKANQTSADKSAVETMRNEVSSMKTSIEQIKTDTQAIKDDVETAKNETLEAKEEVENSLENERIISDKKYARALKAQVEDIEQTQIYAENDVVENLAIKGVELTQVVTEQSENIILLEDYPTTNNHGVDVTVKDNRITLNGTATGPFNLKLPIKYLTSDILNGDFCTGYISEGNFENGNGNLTLYSSDNQNIPLYFPQSSNSNTNYNTRNVSNFNISDKSLNLYITSDSKINNLVIDFTLANVASLDAGIPFTPNSPSLDFPSEVQVASEQNISIFRKNILDTTNINTKLSNLNFISKFDGGLNINGTPTSTWTAIKTQNLTVPINVGTSLYFNYGKTNQLKKDNTDFNVFIRLLDKDGGILYILNNNYSTVVVEHKIYKITFGIQSLIIDKSYNEDIYIELEISDKQPTQFQKYEAIDISIALENGFNGALKDYYNEIKKLDGKWYLVNKFARYVLDGVTVGKKVTAKQSKNNIDKYDVMLGTDKIYINTSKDYWKPTLGICNYLKSDKTYGTISDINSTYTNAIGFWKSGQDQMSFSTEKDRFASIDEANAYLKQLYDAGNPLEFYVLMSEDNYETIELPEDIQKALDKFKLYNDLNNIFIDNGNLSFKYNKSLSKELEEKDEIIDNLLTRVQALEQAQLSQVGGN